MSEESDRVWENLSGELRRVRRQRLAGRVVAVAAVVVAGGFLVERTIRPADGTSELAGGNPAERQVVKPVEAESPLLAVLVYDGEGMRFELMGADRLAGGEMEFSLQPVVRNAGMEEFW